MIDFYKELNLKKEASAKELSNALVRLEAVWNKREMTQPEIAMEKLALINKAKRVFESEKSKATYDGELAADQAIEDPEAIRKAQFEKYFQDAISYMTNRQYDLAKTALERAASYGVADSNVDYFFVASQIYRNNNDLNSSLANINQAIVSAPEEPELYLEKALITDGLRARSPFDKAEEYSQLFLSTINMAITKSAMQHNNDVRGRAIGMLAFYKYFVDGNREEGSNLAKNARELGDRWGNADRVLNDIAEKRAKEEAVRQAAEERRAELEEKKRQEQERLQQEEAEIKRQKEAREQLAQRARMYYFGGWATTVFALIAVFASAGTGGSGAVTIPALLYLASGVLLFYGDAFLNGFTSSLVRNVSIVASIVFLLRLGTTSYTNMGYSQSSAQSTWGLVFALAIVYVILAVAAAITGKNAKRN